MTLRIWKWREGALITLMVNVIHYGRVLRYFCQLSSVSRKGEEEIAGVTCLQAPLY